MTADPQRDISADWDCSIDPVDPDALVRSLCMQAEDTIIPFHIGATPLAVTVALRTCIIGQVLEGLWYELGIESYGQMRGLRIDWFDGEPVYDWSATDLPSCLARLKDDPLDNLIL